MVTNGINLYQIVYECYLDSEKDVNGFKTPQDKEYTIGVKKLKQEFDIIKIMSILRVNKAIHELTLSK